MKVHSERVKFTMNSSLAPAGWRAAGDTTKGLEVFLDAFWATMIVMAMTDSPTIFVAFVQVLSRAGGF